MGKTTHRIRTRLQDINGNTMSYKELVNREVFLGKLQSDKPLKALDISEFEDDTKKFLINGNKGTAIAKKYGRTVASILKMKTAEIRKLFNGEPISVADRFISMRCQKLYG